MFQTNLCIVCLKQFEIRQHFLAPQVTQHLSILEPWMCPGSELARAVLHSAWMLDPGYSFSAFCSIFDLGMGQHPSTIIIFFGYLGSQGFDSQPIDKSNGISKLSQMPRLSALKKAWKGAKTRPGVYCLLLVAVSKSSLSCRESTDNDMGLIAWKAHTVQPLQHITVQQFFWRRVAGSPFSGSAFFGNVGTWNQPLWSLHGHPGRDLSRQFVSF